MRPTDPGGGPPAVEAVPLVEVELGGLGEPDPAAGMDGATLRIALPASGFGGPPQADPSVSSPGAEASSESASEAVRAEAVRADAARGAFGAPPGPAAPDRTDPPRPVDREVLAPPPPSEAVPASVSSVSASSVSASSVSVGPVAIVVQRTIAIGVRAPTHITIAEERESLPPLPPSLLPLPPVESSAEADAGGLDAIGSEAGVGEPEILVEAELPASFDEREEHLEELEEVAEAPPVPSVPPPPPSAAPPPPPSLSSVPSRERPPPPPKAPAPPAEPDTGKRARRKWWEEFFNDIYFRTVPLPQPRTIAAQTEFMVQRLGLRPGMSVLDVGCGLGLHAVELARLGISVVGLDLSPSMLARASSEAKELGLTIEFVQGDMREMTFEASFDAVLSWGTTFGYFDDDQNRQVVERLHRALKPGGLLLLDVVNRDYVFKTQPNNVWFQGDGCVVMEESNANFINSRLTVRRQVMLDDGRQSETVYSIRLYALHELGQLLHQRGFRVVEVSGREATPGVFFGAESPRLLVVAERRPDAPSTGRRTEPDPALPTEPGASAPKE
jgi:2-polyprenyl-3-methyl-5-hydroxy-6-metoxy-1,4-benzoquinol methylase